MPYSWLQVPSTAVLLAEASQGLAKLALTQAELVEAGKGVEKDPSEAQKDAGNYKKAKVSWKGLEITIETPKGNYRSGVTTDGKPWRTRCTAHYGYVRGFGVSGSDGDHVDVFLSGDTDLRSELVFVVNQIDPATGKWDEHKCILGELDEESARALYLSNYQAGWQGLKSITALTLPQLKTWLKFGDTSKEIKDGYFAAPENRKKAAEDLESAFKQWRPCITLVKLAKAKDRPFTIAVDLDGTLAEKIEPYDPVKIGLPRKGAKEWIEAFKDAGARLIVWTTRGDTKLVSNWLKEHKIPIELVNENPDQPEGASGKIIADAYFDDRGVDATNLDEAGAEIMRRLEEPEQDADAPIVITHTVTRILLAPEDILELMTAQRGDD